MTMMMVTGAVGTGTRVHRVMFMCFMVLVVMLMSSLAQPEGWRMIDRFYGFRYELSTTKNSWDSSILEAIQAEADNFACFGWVQRSPSGTIVGEARCSKARGPSFQEKLETVSKDVSKADILVSSEI